MAMTVSSPSLRNTFYAVLIGVVLVLLILSLIMADPIERQCIEVFCGPALRQQLGFDCQVKEISFSSDKYRIHEIVITTVIPQGVMAQAGVAPNDVVVWSPEHGIDTSRLYRYLQYSRGAGPLTLHLISLRDYQLSGRQAPEHTATFVVPK
jgi:hypothetical protein